MKKFLAPAFLFFSLLFLMGMGDLGGSAPADKFPAPEKNFTARVTDRQGLQTVLSQVSFEGKVFLAGKKGQASVTIPFEKMAQVQFSSPEGAMVTAKVILADHKTVEITAEKKLKFFGKAEFGTFQIDVKDLKLITFQP